MFGGDLELVLSPSVALIDQVDVLEPKGHPHAGWRCCQEINMSFSIIETSQQLRYRSLVVCVCDLDREVTKGNL